MSIFVTILLWVAGVVGVILVVAVAVLFFGFKDWIDRGSH